jgi:hypothetical protein
MTHPANSHVLIDPAVKMFQVPVTQTAWGQGQATLEHFVPLRRATSPIPLTPGNYLPTTTAKTKNFRSSAARYLSFRFAETLDEIPWGVYISYEALDRDAADLCALGLTPSDGLHIAYNIAREVGHIRYALDFDLLNLGHHVAHNLATISPQNFSNVANKFVALINDAGFMFGQNIEDIARVQVLQKLQRAPIHQAGFDCLSMLTETPPLSMNQLFEKVEATMIQYARLAEPPASTQIHDTLRTLRGKSHLRKSPAGGQIPIHMIQ